MTSQDPESNQAISKILQQTQPWTRFMGIMGFVSVAIMILVAVGAGVFGVSTNNPQFLAVMVVYPLLAVCYVFPSMYLVRYSNRIREFVAQGQQPQLEAALDAQRSFWKFIGVFTAIGLAVGFCAMVLAVLLPLVMAR